MITQAMHPQSSGQKETQEAMTSLKFTVVPHPPYSPDLAPSDYSLVVSKTEDVKRSTFLSDAAVEVAVYKWISS
jgi:transposase